MKEIKVLRESWRAKFGVYNTDEELFEALPDEIPEAVEKKNTIKKEIEENPDFDIYRFSMQCPYQGIHCDDSLGAKFGRLPTIYICTSANDGYHGTDGAYSETWTAYYMLKDTGKTDSENRRIYKTPKNKHIVFEIHPGSPSSWSWAECYPPKF